GPAVTPRHPWRPPAPPDAATRTLSGTVDRGPARAPRARWVDSPGGPGRGSALDGRPGQGHGSRRTPRGDWRTRRLRTADRGAPDSRGPGSRDGRAGPRDPHRSGGDRSPDSRSPPLPAARRRPDPG